MRKKIELQKQNADKNFDEGFKEFVLYCKAKNLRPATIKFYYDTVHIFNLFFKNKKIKNITTKTIQDFELFLKNKKSENDVSRNTHIRGIRTILYYFMQLDYMKQFKIQLPKMDKKVIETYSDAELKLLLKKPDLKQCSYITYRDWVIVNFLLATGCRAGTLVNIKIKDLDFENDLITYTHTKNRKQQIIPMANMLMKVLIEYLQYRKGGADDYLFVNAYGDKLKVNQLSHNIIKYNHKRGVIKGGVHRFRHTFAKKWILNGGNPFKLQKILDHSSIDMVKNYVNMFTNDLQENFNTFNPLENMDCNNKYISMKKGGRR